MIRVLPDLFEKHIKNTSKEALIFEKTVLLCRLTSAVKKGIDIQYDKVYATSFMIKHLYDKRPAEEFFFVLENMHLAIKYPDNIYSNKNGKRGNWCFCKKINEQVLFCSLEFKKEDNSEERIYVATGFRPKDGYLKNFELLWSWRDGEPSS